MISISACAEIADALTYADMLDALTDRFNDAHAFTAKGERERHGIEPRAVIGVDEVETYGGVAHEDLPLSGCVERDLFFGQHVKPAGLFYSDCTCLCHIGPRIRIVMSAGMNRAKLICGIDEAGRGPWAGPVTAGAVILDPARPVSGLTDSKKLSEKKRLALAPLIKDAALAWGLGWASPEEIDDLNIRQANHLAMRRAVEAMGRIPDAIIIDGNDVPEGLPCPARAIIKGDLTEPCISAASILAKTARDSVMVEMDDAYPGYGFAAHKGYGTKVHSEALERLGPSDIHRMSFKPVRLAARPHPA